MARKIIGLGALMLIFSLKSFAQQKSITGTITAKEDGNSLGGIVIMVKGTDQGLVTADDGHFDLIVTEGDTLELTSRHFADREIVVGADCRYNINLKQKYGDQQTSYFNNVQNEKVKALEALYLSPE